MLPLAKLKHQSVNIKILTKTPFYTELSNCIIEIKKKLYHYVTTYVVHVLRNYCLNSMENISNTFIINCLWRWWLMTHSPCMLAKILLLLLQQLRRKILILVSSYQSKSCTSQMECKLMFQQMSKKKKISKLLT